MEENNENTAPGTGSEEETMKYIVTEEDVKNNPGEGLVVGEEIEIPVKDPSVENGDMAPEPDPQVKSEFNAAGQSKTHVDAMKKTYGSEQRSEQGFNKISEDTNTPTSPGTETEGSIEQEIESLETKNAAGESPTKAEAERKTEEPH